MASTERELEVVHEVEVRNYEALAEQALARERLLKGKCVELEEAARESPYASQASAALADAAQILQSEMAHVEAIRMEEQQLQEALATLSEKAAAAQEVSERCLFLERSQREELEETLIHERTRTQRAEVAVASAEAATRQAEDMARHERERLLHVEQSSESHAGRAQGSGEDLRRAEEALETMVAECLSLESRLQEEVQEVTLAENAARGKQSMPAREEGDIASEWGAYAVERQDAICQADRAETADFACQVGSQDDMSVRDLRCAVKVMATERRMQELARVEQRLVQTVAAAQKQFQRRQASHEQQVQKAEAARDEAVAAAQHEKQCAERAEASLALMVQGRPQGRLHVEHV